MTDDDIAIAPGSDGGIAPEGPNAAPGTFLSATRKKSIGNGTCRLNSTDVVALPGITPQAQSAILVLETAPGGDKASALGRFWMDGTWPNVVEGLPMYHGSVIEVLGAEDIGNMRIISTDGRNHKINVQYFSY